MQLVSERNNNWCHQDTFWQLAIICHIWTCTPVFTPQRHRLKYQAYPNFLYFFYSMTVCTYPFWSVLRRYLELSLCLCSSSTILNVCANKFHNLWFAGLAHSIAAHSQHSSYPFTTIIILLFILNSNYTKFLYLYTFI